MSAPDSSFDPTPSPFGPYVTMTITASMNGEKITCQQLIDPTAWRYYSADPQFLEAAEQQLRNKLGAAIAARLHAPISVHVPVSIPEALSASLARADAGMRNEPQAQRRGWSN
ncbi:hypothetical protein LUR56_39785 [Streptomyces sp. MT29]|nr:hypothetical protein [Streptomyces sp. MT29]